MAEKKKNTQAKHKKTAVKKHRSHKFLENKVLKKEQLQEKEVQEKADPSEPQVSVSPIEPTATAEPANPLGGFVVASSGVLPESPKNQEPQPEPQPPQPQKQQPQQQLSQDADTFVSQPESTTIKSPGAEVISKSVEPAGSVIQDPLTTGDVVAEPEEQSTDDSKKKHLWIIIAIAIFFVLIGGGLWYFRENVMKRAPVKDEIPAPSILKNTPTPATDSAKLEIDLSKYKIKVLNGSGISGEAAKVKNLLEAEEFLIEEIGNADKLTYEKTIIQAKKEVSKEFLSTLKSVLEETYLLDDNEELEESEEIDVIIIIGSSKQP